MATTLNRQAVDPFLRGLRYPLDHDGLVHEAQIRHVPNDLLRAMEELPLGDFQSPEDVLDLLRNQGYEVV